jgi:hypothetical protein
MSLASSNSLGAVASVYSYDWKSASTLFLTILITVGSGYLANIQMEEKRYRANDPMAVLLP